jgi:uncharacterized phiE125 gp8 family phage protein
MIFARLVTPPEAEPVTLDELKQQLRIDHDDEDTFLAAKLRAARRHVEGMTGLALARATYEIVLDRFPSAEIHIPRGPLVSVTSITYVDADGGQGEITADRFTVDSASPEGWIVPVLGFTWPATMKTTNAVRIRFVAGYDAAELPEPLREAILQLASWWYEARETATLDEAKSIPFGVADLVDAHRQWSF